MKKLISKYTLSMLALFVGLTLPLSCIIEKESEIAGKGPNGFRIPVADHFALVAFNAVQETRPILDVFRDVNSNAELEKPASISFTIDEATLDTYNDENDTNLELLPAANYTLNVEGGTLTFESGDFARSITLELKPDGLDLTKQYAIPFLFSNPASGYSISQTGDYAVIQITVKNKYDGPHAYSGHIGRYDAAAACAPQELGGNVTPGLTLNLSTTGANSVGTVLQWATGGTIGGIGSSQIITIDPSTNAVTVTPVGASPANWAPINGQPNSYDPNTGAINISYRWGAVCSGGLYGYTRHVRVTLTPN